MCDTKLTDLMNTNKYPNLTSPIKLGNLFFRNRIFSAPIVREVGDCVRPANITKAVYEGYHAALDI